MGDDIPRETTNFMAIDAGECQHHAANHRKVVVNIDDATVVGELQTTAAAIKNTQESHKWVVVVVWW